jgi:hypothetical protein
MVEVRGKSGFTYEALIITRTPKTEGGTPFTCNLPAKLSVPLLNSLKKIVGVVGEKIVATVATQSDD